MPNPPHETQPDQEPNLYCVDCEIAVGNEPLCPICEETTLDRQKLPERADCSKLSPTGREIEGFRIDEVLSRGPYGILCRASQRALSREVALKLYPLSAVLLPQIKGMLAAARKVAELEHPGVARVYKAGFAGPWLYIARRRVLGEPLSERMARSGAMGWMVAADLVRRVGTALASAHAAGVVHGNLKPTNIIVDEGGEVALTDFGAGAEISTEMHGPWSGHYEWAPERWIAREVDHRADLYSLGVIFYALLCGRRPFEIHEPRKLMFAHTSLPPPNPSNVRSDLSDPLCAIVMKLLEKEIEARYPAAQALLDDLDRLRRGERVQAYLERKDPVECRFCGTTNAPDQQMCTVCKEPLRGTEVMLAFTQREDEFQCRLCEHYVRKGVSACPTCMNPTCIKCKSASAESSGMCAGCGRAGGEGRSLWGKITDLFGPRRPK
ncbi:MAG TPA: serine/threonine-protein kinase [Planctomycetota bacterium]|nr:serine/threonine-protein kinase [Planctomycetota bacterium]